MEMDIFYKLWLSTGFSAITGQQAVMLLVCTLLLWLGIAKKFEPLLLVPIAFGGILANIPLAGITSPEGGLGSVYNFGINGGLFPIFIFIGVGAMTDFGPLIANPKTAILGGAAQFGIFTTLLGALYLTRFGFDFSIQDAASIGIIGGADGPTAIYLTSRLAPDLLGAVAVAAYSYMALVPIIQPPIMRLLTTHKERTIVMKQMRPVSRREKILFPLTVLILCALFLPDAAPLIGAITFGNLLRECMVTERLSLAAQNELINIVTILLGLSVGSKLAAEQFLQKETLGILALGALAFAVGTAGGVLMAKVMNLFLKEKINPLIGAAGVSAVPMAARVVNMVGQKTNRRNYLLMHAMGPNVSGVIGSAVAAGILLAMLK
jgi:oxaloacetate decarboxylase beta subunit